MINILRNIGGVERVACRVAHDNATVIGEIMAREEVNIDVVVDAPLALAVGDYVRVDDTVYTLNRETSFDKKSAVEYRYDLLFESPLYRLLDKLFVHPITGLSTFTISRTLGEWVKLVVDCVNEIDPGWTVAADIFSTEPKSLNFESTSCREALNRFVSEFGVEFFLVRKEIHFVNRIENSTDLVFEQGKGKGLYTISQEPVDNENTITRILAYGGSQNVAPGEGDAKGRLCLPEKYLENFSEYSKIVEKEVEFKDIFPKFSGSVDSVSGEFNRIITCSAIDFDIAKQAIGGTPVKINILTGDLMGESFEFGWKNETKEITLIRREDETALPGQDGKKPLIPSESRKVIAGDSFNFTDLNMPASYKDNAVIQLRKKAAEWLAYYSRSRVKFALEVDHRYLRGKHVLKAGDLVTIKIPETGINKLLRVTSIERNLKTGKMSCTVSNYLDEKWAKKIEGAISDLRSTVSGGGNTGGGGGSTLDIIETNDLTPETDQNVYSASRAKLEDEKKLDKTTVVKQSVAGEVDFEKGFDSKALSKIVALMVGEYLKGITGAFINEKGEAEFHSVTIREWLQVDKLLYNEIEVFEGEKHFGAGAVIEEVLNNEDGLITLKLRQKEGGYTTLAAGDLLEGGYESAGRTLRSWMRVNRIIQSDSTIEVLLRYPDMRPCKYMSLSRIGNLIDPERRRSYQISVKGGYQRILDGVGVLSEADAASGLYDSYDIRPYHIKYQSGLMSGVRIPENLPVPADAFSLFADHILCKKIYELDDDGETIITNKAFKGVWKPGMYKYYWEVTHNGCTYLCIVSSTTDQPGYASSDWLMTAGDPRLKLTIGSTNGLMFVNNMIETTLIAEVTRGWEDLTGLVRLNDWIWTRETKDALEDAAWNASHRITGNQLAITLQDLGGRIEVDRSCKFTCEAVVYDSGNEVLRCNNHIEF